MYSVSSVLTGSGGFLPRLGTCKKDAKDTFWLNGDWGLWMLLSAAGEIWGTVIQLAEPSWDWGNYVPLWDTCVPLWDTGDPPDTVILLPANSRGWDTVPSTIDRVWDARLQPYPAIYIIAMEIAGNYLFLWKDENWLTCSIIYMEVIGENIKNIK